MPSRLQRFIEVGKDGEATGRVAYVLKPALLVPTRDNRWQLDASFNAAEAVLKESSLKAIYKKALAEGVAIVASGLAG